MNSLKKFSRKEKGLSTHYCLYWFTTLADARVATLLFYIHGSVELLAETLVKLPERLVEKDLTRGLLAEAWDLCQCKLL